MSGFTVTCDQPARARAGAVEHYYHQLVEQLPAAIYTTDAQGRILQFNHAAAELWGREPEIGKDLWCGSWRIFQPDGSPMPLDKCPMAIALTEGRCVRDVEIVVERPDGTRRRVLPYPSPLRDETGAVIGAVNMLVDITDRCQVDRDIRDRDERLHLATQTGKLGLWDWDIVSDHVTWSDSLYSIHGVDPQTFPATVAGFASLVHPDDRERVSKSIGRAINDGAPYELEFRAVRPDGNVIWLFTNARVIREEGHAVRMLGATMDITDRKRAEAAVTEAKEAAEAASRSKDKFLAVLSHELRTPLTPVLLIVAARQNDPDLAPDVREDLLTIRRNVELETKLIDDLLDLSRITSGKLRLVPQAVDLNDAVRHVCGICHGQILDKDIRLHCQFDPDAGAVIADPARLQQVLWNVIKNAAKFSPQGGEIHVATQRVAEDRVAVRVRDNGAGIDREMLPRIFDAFEQGDARITKQFGGLGLGLAISKALIDLHAGAIRAESDGPGAGATFTIELPSRLAASQPQPREPHNGSPVTSSKLRLLVVEDHPDTAAVLGKLLGAAGYLVKTAHSAAGAIHLASREPFDLLISDIGLPDATGYELMQQLRQRQTIQGIAMSGYGMDEDIRRSRDAGFSDHLVKPINLTQLHEAIRRLAPTAS